MKNCNCDNKKPSSDDTWLRKRWRPYMAAQYMVVCLIDFIVFPVVWSGVQVYMKMPMTQWDPLTLKSTGLYHLAMGGVLGVAAWTRGQENIQSVQNMQPMAYQPQQYPQAGYPQPYQQPVYPDVQQSKYSVYDAPSQAQMESEIDVMRRQEQQSQVRG